MAGDFAKPLQTGRALLPADLVRYGCGSAVDMSKMKLLELWALFQIAIHMLLGLVLLAIACVFVVLAIFARVARIRGGK